MRFANNFNPEWGYLAPAPSFARTARIVLVAAAVGASAGGAVVFSLVVHPAAEESSVAARTLVQPATQMQATTQPALQPQIHAGARPAVEGEFATLTSAHTASAAPPSPAASEFEHEFDRSGPGKRRRASGGASRYRRPASSCARRDRRGD